MSYELVVWKLEWRPEAWAVELAESFQVELVCGIPIGSAAESGLMPPTLLPSIGLSHFASKMHASGLFLKYSLFLQSSPILEGHLTCEVGLPVNRECSALRRMTLQVSEVPGHWWTQSVEIH